MPRVDGSGPSSGADKECLCPAGKFTSADAQSSCTTAGQGKYTVDAANVAMSSGAVGEKAATKGHYTVDTSGKAVSSGAVDEKEAVKGSYACRSDVDENGSGPSSGADKECLCPAGKFTSADAQSSCTTAGQGKYTVDAANVATSSGAVGEKEAVKGSYACMSGASVDGSGPSSGADKECLCPAGKFTSADAQSSCTTAGQGKYTVDAANVATSSGAVGEKAATKGHYTVDTSGNVLCPRAPWMRRRQ